MRPRAARRHHDDLSAILFGVGVAYFSNASTSFAASGERDNTTVAMSFCAALDFCAVGLLAFAMHGK